MTQPSVLELAKQGNAEAIASLINRSLQPKGISAKASLMGSVLEITLQSAQVPNQKIVMTLIHKGMITLEVASIQRVHVYAHRLMDGLLMWDSEFELNSRRYDSAEESLQNFLPTQGATATSQQNAAESIPMSQAPAKNYNQQGIIPVQKLTLFKQVPQEYQDIIIRFTDPHSGTVRCLSTLTELVQAVNKSGFSFSAVAANASLRNLLDTITDFSSTDDNGDQIIHSVSILQPGQQWQNVKIRLVTKIFFEPEGYAPEYESSLSQVHADAYPDLNAEPSDRSNRAEVITLDVIEARASEDARDEKPNVMMTTPPREETQAIKETVEKEAAELPSESAPQSEAIQNTVESLFAEFDFGAEPETSTPYPVEHEPQISETKDDDDSESMLLDDFANAIAGEEVPKTTNEVTAKAAYSSSSNLLRDKSEALTLSGIEEMINASSSDNSDDSVIESRRSVTLDDFSQELWELV